MELKIKNKLLVKFLNINQTIYKVIYIFLHINHFIKPKVFNNFNEDNNNYLFFVIIQIGEFMKNIYDLDRINLENYFFHNGEKRFRATQLFEGLYQKKYNSFDNFINIKKETIELLKKNFIFSNIEIVEKEETKDVIKYLFRLSDGNMIESVLMFHDYGNSLCVSSQIGCNMGCRFCQSGQLKLIRNLNVHEMVCQLLIIEKDINKRISHVVLMGIGEPFDNYENVLKFIKIINDDKGLAIGARHITVSTCGLVPYIKKFMIEKRQVNLAVSLNAPNDELRNKLMPINKVYNLSSLINVINEYIKKTNRRVTFEYIMLDNINDSKDLAIELCNLLKGINCYVNLIPFNTTNSSKFKKSSEVKIKQFYDILKKNKINVTIRKEFGQRISAACGQLRANVIGGK